MATDYQRAYNKGLTAGRSGKWPDHVPPLPPDPVGEVCAALIALREAIDAELAKFDPDDPLNVTLSPHIDRATKALSAVTQHIKDAPFTIHPREEGVR